MDFSSADAVSLAPLSWRASNPGRTKDLMLQRLSPLGLPKAAVLPPPPAAFWRRYLCVNYTLCTMLRLERREFKAAVLMSSQKTLPVSVTVISFLGSLGQEGLMTLPCIVGHMSQLFIDAYISSRWAAEDQRQNSRVANAPEDDADKRNTTGTMGSTPEATGNDSQVVARV